MAGPTPLPERLSPDCSRTTTLHGVVVVITMLVMFFGIQERVAVSAADSSRRPGYHWPTIKPRLDRDIQQC